MDINNNENDYLSTHKKKSVDNREKFHHYDELIGKSSLINRNSAKMINKNNDLDEIGRTNEKKYSIGFDNVARSDVVTENIESKK